MRAKEDSIAHKNGKQKLCKQNETEQLKCYGKRCDCSKYTMYYGRNVHMQRNC